MEEQSLVRTYCIRKSYKCRKISNTFVSGGRLLDYTLVKISAKRIVARQTPDAGRPSSEPWRDSLSHLCEYSKRDERAATSC